MAEFSYGGYCDEIVAQTDLLRSHLKGADSTVPVPTCPGWNLGQLVRHVGEGHRWAETIVRNRAEQPPSDARLRDLSGSRDEDADRLDTWLAEGAKRLAAALRGSGPTARMWTPLEDGPHTAWFYARRFTHETVVHRADAALAAETEFAMDHQVALDAVDEWMELGSLPQILELNPRQRELLGPGRTVHFHATDTAPDLAAEWLLDLTGEVITWRRAHEKAAVAVRGPMTELLLLIYRRRTPHDAAVEIFGDRELLAFWFDRAAFG